MIRLYVVPLLLLIAPLAHAQINGPSTPCTAISTTYTYDDATVYITPNWTITNGSVISSSSSGTLYTAVVQWTAAGSGTLNFRSKTNSIATLNVTVGATPGLPSASNITQCGPGNVTATPGANGNTVKWYNSTFAYISTGTTSPVTNITTTYQMTTFNSTTGCESGFAAVTITINPRPSAPAVSNASLCGSGTISATVGSGGDGVRWYAASTGGSPLATSLTSPMATATTTWYAVSYNAATGCESNPRTPVTLTVEPIPVITPSGPTFFIYGGGTSSVTLNTTSFFSWEWKRDGAPVATTQSHLTSNTGSYTVTTKTSSTALACTSLPTWVGTNLTGQPTPINFISSTVIFKEGVASTTSLYSLQSKDLAQTIAYQDGLGRTFQTVGVGLSGNQTDIVSPVAFGLQGVVDSTFLPYVTSTKDGRFKFNSIRHATTRLYTGSEQYNFYQSTALVASDTKPFARTVHRQAPDARVTEQGAPGTDWQPGTSHAVRNTVIFNNSTTYAVKRWLANGTTPGNYPNNTVIVNETTDENNNKVQTFTNKQGQTVLKRVQVDATNWLDTYYIYDDFGRLKYQVPPKAVSTLGAGTSVTITALEELIYKYTYDARGRLIEKKVPGAAVQWIVYDKLNRPVLVQDGNLRSTNRWMFTKWDVYGRPVYTGLYTNTTQTSRTEVQALLDIIDYTTAKHYEDEGTAVHGYTNQAWPTAGTSANVVLTVNYYDHYDFDRNGTADYTYDAAHLSGLPATASSATRNLPTGSKRVMLDANGNTTANWLVGVVFYDPYDRTIQTLANNHLNTALQDKSSVLYADRVHVDKTKTTHTGLSTVTVQQRYTYDPNWRTTGIYHSINGAAEQQLASYTYNVLGQLVDKRLHVNGASSLQSVDMRYNIRGWLKSINNAQLVNDDNVTNDDTNDYFGLELLYNTIESGLNSTAYYNGNVSAVKWKAANTGMATLESTNGTRGYAYTYDKSDRLTTAAFRAQSTASGWTKQVDTQNETLTYDNNGNILTLTRTQNNRGITTTGGLQLTSAVQTTDNLTYSYTANTNSLLKVEDAVGGTIGQAGFTNGANIATEYTYNTDGSLTTDQNKGISSITYNFLGKPQMITYSSGKKVEYVYDAAGSKLTMRTYQSTTLLTTTNYAGGYVYEGNSPALSFFSSPEGRVVKNGANYEYQYAIADHQGNTRIIFSSVTPSALDITATFEGNVGDQSAQFSNVNSSKISTQPLANNTAGGDKVIGLNQTYAVGPGKSLKVYPGEVVTAEVWCYYEAASGYGSSQGITPWITAVAGAFGGVSGGGGESGSIFSGVNNAIGTFGMSGNQGSTRPSAYLNYIIFDQQYKVISMGWTVVPTTANFAKRKITVSPPQIKEAGYVFVYLSYENQSNNLVLFDDLKVTHTKNNIVQYNEYYAFQHTTSYSWTRENTTGNNFLGNGGTEVNTTTALYDLDFRNFDPLLARMHQIDPVADKYGSLTPYNFSFNDPLAFNDPSGADPDGRANWTSIVLPDFPARPMDYGTAGGPPARGGGPMTGFYWGTTMSSGMGAGIVRNGNTFTIYWNRIGSSGGQWTASGGYRDLSARQAWDVAISIVSQRTGTNLVVFHGTAGEVVDEDGMPHKVTKVNKKRFEGTEWIFEIAENDEKLREILKSYKSKNLKNLVIVSHGSNNSEIPMIALSRQITTNDFVRSSDGQLALKESSTGSDADLFAAIVNSVEDGGNVVFIACNAGNGSFGTWASAYAAREAPNLNVNVYLNKDYTQLTYSWNGREYMYDIQFNRPLTPKPVKGWIETGTINGMPLGAYPLYNIMLGPEGTIISIPRK